MSLDVGVVQIEYLSQPRPPIYDFLFDLMLDPFSGAPDEDDTWGGGWDNNGWYEFSRVGLRTRASRWATSHNLEKHDRNALMKWIRNLPWQEDMVMLHLSN